MESAGGEAFCSPFNGRCLPLVLSPLGAENAPFFGGVFVFFLFKSSLYFLPSAVCHGLCSSKHKSHVVSRYPLPCFPRPRRSNFADTCTIIELFYEL